jgi:hypothetical protein
VRGFCFLHMGVTIEESCLDYAGPFNLRNSFSWFSVFFKKRKLNIIVRPKQKRKEWFKIPEYLNSLWKFRLLFFFFFQPKSAQSWTKVSLKLCHTFLSSALCNHFSPASLLMSSQQLFCGLPTLLSDLHLTVLAVRLSRSSLASWPAHCHSAVARRWWKTGAFLNLRFPTSFFFGCPVRTRA